MESDFDHDFWRFLVFGWLFGVPTSKRRYLKMLLEAPMPDDWRWLEPKEVSSLQKYGERASADWILRKDGWVYRPVCHNTWERTDWYAVLE